MIHVCDKAIGPTFAKELEAHGGLLGEHFSWIVPAPDGSPAWIEFFDDTPEDVIAGVLSVFESHDPTSVSDKLTTKD